MDTSRSSQARFSEVQYFRQPWALAIVGFIGILSWYVFLPTMLSGTVGLEGWTAVLIVVVFGIAFPLLFLIIRLEVAVSDRILSFRMFPLQVKWREVPLADITGAEAITYRPMREYGGWGIRYGRKGRAYTVSGNRGVYITSRSGMPFLLGSCKPGDLAQTIGGGASQEINE